MNPLQAIEAGQSGLYTLHPPVDLDTVHQKALEQGFHFVHLDAHAVHTKDDFMKLTKTALQFPAHFGENWDALLDMLRDLSWLPATTGYVLLFTGLNHFAEQHPTNYGTALDVLRDAAHFWAERKKNKLPMIILVEQAQQK